MSRFDPDLVAVRELPPGLPEPTNESVSRTWHLVIRRVSDRRLRSRRWLAPVTAAAAVAALVVGGVTVLTPDRKPSVPLNPQRVMDRLIDEAARIRPVEIPPGQLLYVREENSRQPQPAMPGTRETWFDGQTLMPLRVRADGADTSVDGPDQPGSMAEDNRNIVAAGGDPTFPTPPFLASLPTERSALLARLDKVSYGGMTVRAGREWQPVVQLWALLSRAEPRLSPELRVALYQVIAGLPGLVASEVTVDGRRCWAVGLKSMSGDLTAILFDQRSGRAVGHRRQWSGSGAPPGVAQTLWTFAVVPDTNRTE